MEVFRAVMVSGGVNSAATLLHVSPPAISKVLAQAAKASGLVLFERIRGRLIPTPEAQELYEEIDKLWQGVEAVRDISQELAQPQRATLRLVCTASLAPFLVARTLEQVYSRIPRLQCRVRVVAPEVAYQQLLQRESHLGVLLGPYDHPNLVTIKSYRCGLACVMRSDHALARKRRVTAADLAGQRVITSPESTPFGQTLRRAFGSAASAMHLDIDCVSSTTATWFAQAGIGVAVVDQASIAGGLLPGLEVRPFQSNEKLEVRLIRNRYRPMSVADRAFTDLFEKTWRSVM